MRILYLRPANITNPRHPGKDSVLFQELKKLAELDDISYDSSMDEHSLASLIRHYDILLTMWQNPRIPDELADNPGNLRYICNVTGEMKRFISETIICSPYLTVSNWGDAPAFSVAEGSITLLMYALKSLGVHHTSQLTGNTGKPKNLFPGSLYQLPVGIFGMGVIGKQFASLIRPFDPFLMAYDPYVTDFPDFVHPVHTLRDLFSESRAVVLHAALSDETKHIISRELLSLLPDHSIIVNTARGGLIDQDALLAEVMQGRLRAALDVLDPNDALPPEHPARQCDNLIITSHSISHDDWSFDPHQLDRKSKICIDNIRRFIHGEPVQFVMTPERYRRST